MKTRILLLLTAVMLTRVSCVQAHPAVVMAVAGHAVATHVVVAHGIAAHGVAAHAVAAHGMAVHGAAVSAFSAHTFTAHGVVVHGVVAHGVIAHGTAAHFVGTHALFGHPALTAHATHGQFLSMAQFHTGLSSSVHPVVPVGSHLNHTLNLSMVNSFRSNQFGQWNGFGKWHSFNNHFFCFRNPGSPPNYFPPRPTPFYNPASPPVSIPGVNPNLPVYHMVRPNDALASSFGGALPTAGSAGNGVNAPASVPVGGSYSPVGGSAYPY